MTQSLWSWLGDAVVRSGHALERACFGQSSAGDNRLSADAPKVQTSAQAQAGLTLVRRQLSEKFSMELRWPILLELKAPPAEGWKASFYSREGNLARHTPVNLNGNPAHQVLVRPGLERTRFRALVAHELTHAFQREHNLLNQNLALREGMARWVEFHFSQGTAEAARLLNLKHHTFGSSVRTILDFENQHGRPATIQWLRSLA